MSVQEAESFEGVAIKEEMIDAQQVNPTSTRSLSVCIFKCEETNENNNNNLKAESVSACQSGAEHSNQVGEVVEIESVLAALAKAKPLDYKEQCENRNPPLSPWNVTHAKGESSSGPTESDCGIQGGTLTVRTKHKLKNHKQKQTRKFYSCSFCDYKSHQSIDFARHKRKHTGEKPYSCSFCDYRASQSSHLASHQRIHTGEKPFSCSLCNYKSSHLSSLNIHKRTHTGEKRYSCTLCDYKTNQSSALTVHKRTHTGEKPYSCSLCNYQASRSNHLAEHKLTHTGEKPYSCSLCDYKASRAYSLLVHEQSKHKEEMNQPIPSMIRVNTVLGGKLK